MSEVIPTIQMQICNLPFQINWLIFKIYFRFDFLVFDYTFVNVSYFRDFIDFCCHFYILLNMVLGLFFIWREAFIVLNIFIYFFEGFYSQRRSTSESFCVFFDKFELL